ncbi:zinc finger and SCAN domain-containing protein 21-like isoform X23 [Haliotis rubra]|uniref:zinc finger and SCAN domain-containing protein 21-like isoform X23 n=1 Tax=Haliotis rubra TaxID=36100 RepID=UPI001EE5ECE5|nr:zinc finger and SCAN domain-containing protein 21-like isoform X23 [Haliotis rubra]
MFIETLEFTIPVELCNVFSSLQKGPTSNVEFPASVNSYGTTQDANVQVVLRSNKLTFKVDGVSSNASMISKSECKTLKLSVFDVDRTLMPQENDNDNYNSNNMSTIQTVQQTVYLSHPAKRLHESSVSMPQPAAKSSRTSFSESPRPRSPVHRRPHSQISSSPSNHSHQSKPKNDTPVNVKQEPEDPDLIEIEPDHDPDDVVPKKETPYMQIDYSSDVPHTQTSKAALDRLSHPQSSHSQSPGSSSSSFYQNVPHVPDYAEPSTSQARYGDQSADDFLVFQDENDDGDDNEADYSNDDFGSSMGGPGFAIRSKTLHTEEYRQSAGAQLGCESRLGDRKEVWICEECGKQFSKSSNRNTHYKTMHGNASYVCVCGKAYRYPQGLNKHKRCCSMYQQFLQTGSL